MSNGVRERGSERALQEFRMSTPARQRLLRGRHNREESRDHRMMGVGAAAQVRAAARAAAARLAEGGARVHAHHAPRQSAVGVSREARDLRRAHPRQSVAGAAQRCARGIPGGYVSRPRRDRTSPRAVSTSRRSATWSTSTCRCAPEDYIHRVGRTARAEATGEAYTFVSPKEAEHLRAIERAVGKALPPVTIPEFDYDAKTAAKLEIPIAERMATHRAQRAFERQRTKEKEARRAGGGAGAVGACSATEWRCCAGVGVAVAISVQRWVERRRAAAAARREAGRTERAVADFGDVDHSVRLKSITRFGRRRSLVSVDDDQAFRGKSITS